MRSAEINQLLKMGVSQSEIRRLKKSIKGSTFSIGVGTTSGSLQLSGTAKYLMGFRTFQPASAGDISITIIVNQEIIWTSVNQSLSDTNFSSVKDEYIEAFRKLNSQDVFNIEFTATGASTCDVIIFYLN